MSRNRTSNPVYYQVPLLQVSQFFGRETQLEELEAAIQKKRHLLRQVTVILGMGGQGKTQLALKYCEHAWKACHFQAIFWLDASNMETLLSSYENIATKLLDEKASIRGGSFDISVAKAAIARLTIPWLMVLDNFDNPDQMPNLIDLLPFGPEKYGAALVTSRHLHSARLGDAICLDQMAEIEALDLFFSRLGYERNENNLAEAKKLIDQFGHLPLAIDQAAAYIKARNLNLAFFDKKYRESSKTAMWSDLPSFWEYKKRNCNTGLDIPASIAVTFDFSLKDIQEHTEGVGDLLSFFAFFNRLNLSEELCAVAIDAEIHHQGQMLWTCTCLTDDRWDSLKFQDILVELQSLSLVLNIQLDTEYATFTVHPMIVEWLLLRLTAAQRATFAKLALDTIAAILHKEAVNLDSMLFARRQWLLTHLDAVWGAFGSSPAGANLQSVSTDTIVVLASSFANFGRYTQAEALYQHCVARLHNQQNNPEPKIETRMFDLYDALGLCYMNTVDYDSSVNFFTKAVELKASVLGPDHPLTLNSMQSVGNIHRRLQKYKESSEMLEHVMARTKDVHGPESHAHLTAANNLALVYRCQGRLDEAVQLGRQTLESKLRCKGAESISTLTTMQCLGGIYRDLGDHRTAERVYSSALKGQESLLGMMNARTLHCASQLEKLYRSQGRLEDAGRMREKMNGDLGMTILRASRYGTDD
ncbi:unnamed protein product [Penicillium salamii]|nr:unnamed protein product [Penicillium salamii]